MKTSSCPCCATDGASMDCAVPPQAEPRGHDHDHGHAHEHGGNSPKREAAVLAASAVFFALVLALENSLAARFGEPFVPALYAVPYLVCGLPVFRVALGLVRSGDVMNEFTLMAGATLVAIGLGQYAEAVGVMLFYRIGEFFQELAAERSRGSIQSLLASKPVKARLVVGNGVTTVPVESVRVGDSVLVRAGESVPLDGIVISGATHVDQSPLTGESVPVAVAEGDRVLGGSINAGGVITVRATAAFADTHMARVLEMVENASKHKAPTERFLTRFARYYTPAVVFLALLVATLPPLVSGADWHTWVYRALVLLVISCPCALVISVPLSYFAGIGAASRKGVLVKGGVVFDGLSHIKTVVFDKTGTLTQGEFTVTRLAPEPGITEDDLLLAAALAEADSNHPVALAVMRRAGQSFTRPQDLVVQEVPGKGMRAKTGGVTYLAGSEKLLRDADLLVPDVPAAGAVVFVVRDSTYCGYLEVTDTVKPEARSAVAALKARGLKTLMLSGDRREAVAKVAKEVGVDAFEAELLPEGKVGAIDRLADRNTTAFVGDGINDAPTLALARVGIAMGGVGAEAAVEAPDAVIHNDYPDQVSRLFDLGSKVRSIVWQNICLALGIKILFMGFGIVGLGGLWEAVFADVGVALLAVLNAARAMRG